MDPWHQALFDLWEKQTGWSEKANALKSTKMRLTPWLMGATWLGTVLGALTSLTPTWLGQDASHDGMVRVVSLMAAAMVTTSAFLTKNLLGPKQDEEWVTARTIAEELKAEGYIYAAAAPPYGDGAVPLALHNRRLELEHKGRALLPVVALPEAERRQRHPHERIDVEQYLALRVNQQIKFHAEKARGYKGKLDVFRKVGMALGAAAVIVGLLAARSAQHAPINVFLGVITTTVAMLQAFVMGQRYEYLASSYAATASNLDDLRRRWRLATDKPASLGQRIVLDSEALLAAQNRTWSEKFTKSVADALSEPSA